MINTEIKTRISEKVEAIKKMRQELINDYYLAVAEYDDKNNQIKELLRSSSLDVSDFQNIWNDSDEIRGIVCSLKSAINGLRNSLYHLGEKEDIFWGK